MRSLFLLISTFFALGASASNEIKTQIDVPALSSPYSMEPSFSLSSLGNGSQFISVALTARLMRWFHLGLEGDVPANYDNNAQLYMARGFMRFSLLSGKDHLYLQGGITQGFHSNTSSGVLSFAGLDGLVGYTHMISKNWGLGGRVGAQYLSGFSLSNGSAQMVSNQSGFYNRLSLVASYNF